MTLLLDIGGRPHPPRHEPLSRDGAVSRKEASLPVPSQPVNSTTGPNPSVPIPLRQQATTDVIELVVGVEMDRLLGNAVSKYRALTALAARQEIEHRMRRHRMACHRDCPESRRHLERDRSHARPRRRSVPSRVPHHAPQAAGGQSRLEYLTTLRRQQAVRLTTYHDDPAIANGPEL